MYSASSFAVAISLLASLLRVTALPHIRDQCAIPTTTTTVTGRPIAVCDRLACIAPTSVCAAGEPTGPTPPPAYTATVITAADSCAVTVSLGVPFFCGGCASCTSEAASSTSPTAPATTTTTTTTTPPVTFVNPGGPRMTTARQHPIIDHKPDGPVLHMLSILTIVKRDDPITNGHGGGPMITARDDRMTEGHAGGPLITARDDRMTEGHAGGPMITARDYPITEGHAGGPLIMATETPSSS